MGEKTLDLFHERVAGAFDRHAEDMQDSRVVQRISVLMEQLDDDRYDAVKLVILSDLVDFLGNFEASIAAFRADLEDVLSDFEPPLPAPEPPETGITVTQGTGPQAGQWFVMDGALCVKAESDERLAREYADAMRLARHNGWIGDQASVLETLNEGKDPLEEFALDASAMRLVSPDEA